MDLEMLESLRHDVAKLKNENDGWGRDYTSIRLPYCMKLGDIWGNIHWEIYIKCSRFHYRQKSE